MNFVRLWVFIVSFISTLINAISNCCHKSTKVMRVMETNTPANLACSLCWTKPAGLTFPDPRSSFPLPLGVRPCVRTTQVSQSEAPACFTAKDDETECSGVSSAAVFNCVRACGRTLFVVCQKLRSRKCVKRKENSIDISLTCVLCVFNRRMQLKLSKTRVVTEE